MKPPLGGFFFVFSALLSAVSAVQKIFESLNLESLNLLKLKIDKRLQFGCGELIDNEYRHYHRQ